MASVFRPVYVAKLPHNPTIADRLDENGDTRKHVRVKDKRGRMAWYPLTADGKSYLRPNQRWYAVYVGADGETKREPGYTDRERTLRMAFEREQEAERSAADHTYQHTKRPLAEHLADFERALLAKGNTPDYCELVRRRLDAMFTGCKFVALSDLSASRVMEWLAEQRKPQLVNEAMKPGISMQTSNYHLAHAKTFCRWMVRDRRMKANLFEHLHGGNVRSDRRHDRRELTDAELLLLFETAEKSADVVFGFDGKSRAVLYTLAAATGFRASELESLTPASFALDSKAGPTATVPAAYTKNGRLAVQPLPLDVAEMLRGYLAGRPNDEPIFPGEWARKKRGAKLLRVDLAAAGIPYSVEGPDGPLFADFHALRHSYITLLSRSGVSMRTVQHMARHSTPTLTARYAHVGLSDMTDATDKLPSLVPAKPDSERMRATGTDGKNESACTKHVRENRTPLQADAQDCTNTKISQQSEQSPQTLEGKGFRTALQADAPKVQRVSEGIRTPDNRNHNPAESTTKQGISDSACTEHVDRAQDCQTVIDAWPTLSADDRQRILEIIAATAKQLQRPPISPSDGQSDDQRPERG